MKLVVVLFWRKTDIQYLINYNLVWYRGYLDDTFLLFSSGLRITKVLNHMNSKHRYISFTEECEENSLSFLDINFFHDIANLSL